MICPLPPLCPKTNNIAVIGVGWAPFDTAAKQQQENLLTNTYVAALRKLAPNMGAYVNEVLIHSFRPLPSHL
jgi:hypothetical protein